MEGSLGGKKQTKKGDICNTCNNKHFLKSNAKTSLVTFIWIYVIEMCYRNFMKLLNSNMSYNVSSHNFNYYLKMFYVTIKEISLSIVL